MKDVRYICNLCKTEDEPKYLFGIKYVRIEGDVRELEFHNDLDKADAHLCTSCIVSITMANEKGSFRAERADEPLDASEPCG